MKGPVAGPCAGHSFEMCIGPWPDREGVCSCRSWDVHVVGEFEENQDLRVSYG